MMIESMSNLQDVELLLCLERESSLPTSLSPDIAPHTSSSKDVIKDVLVYAKAPIPFNHSYEFEWVKALGTLVS